MKPWSILLDLRIAHQMTYEAIEEFIDGLAIKAEVELKRLNEAINQEGNSASTESTEQRNTEDAGDPIDSHFCYGVGINQKKAQRCYLDRYIHPSWTEADSQSCIEWIRAYQKADEMQNGQVSHLLRTLWETENTSR